MASLEEFRKLKESGVDIYAEQEQNIQGDAGLENNEFEEWQQEEIDNDEILPDEESEVEHIDNSEDEEIPEKEKLAWSKRAERERKKAREEAEEELKAKYEAELNKYKRFFDQSNIDPDQALRLLEENKLKQEARSQVLPAAQQMAYNNGWTEEETELYIQQQSDLYARQRQQDNELRELRVSVAINELADNPSYPGIKGLKPQIVEFIRNNPLAKPDQAYWAVGGAALAEQLKLEAKQREVAKREAPKRKVVKDGGTSTENKNAIPAEIAEFARKNGLKESEIKFMMNEKANNLTEFRKLRGK